MHTHTIGTLFAELLTGPPEHLAVRSNNKLADASRTPLLQEAEFIRRCDELLEKARTLKKHLVEEMTALRRTEAKQLTLGSDRPGEMSRT